MAQITGPLSILDGQATPVAHNFYPEVVAPLGSTFVERTSGVSNGFIRIKTGLSPASTQRPTYRCPFEVSYPVVQTVSGVSSVAYTGRFVGYFVVPDAMTAAERANLQAYAANGLANAVIKAQVKDLDPAY